MANTWNKAGTTWGYNSWESDTVTVSLTGISITGSVGTPDAFNEHGWGRSTWGSDDWGDFSLTVFPTGFSITGTLNDDVAAFPNTGWGRDFYGEEPWGDSYDPVVTLDSFGITASLGTLPYAQSVEGWARDSWGDNEWGTDAHTIDLTGFEITGHLGPDAWGEAPWNEMIGWGGDLKCETTQLSVISLTGIEGTLSLGAPTLNYDFKVILTTSLQMSAGIGVPNINNGADHTQGVGSLLATMSLGTPTLGLGVPLTGIQATMSLGSVSIVNEEIIYPTGLSGTLSLGSTTVADMAIGVSGYSITGSLGTPVVTDMQVGLSGIEMTGTLGSAGMSPLHYKDVDITGNTSYTSVEHSA